MSSSSDSSSSSSLSVASVSPPSSPPNRKRKRATERTVLSDSTPNVDLADADEPVLSHAAKRKQKKNGIKQSGMEDSTEALLSDKKKQKRSGDSATQAAKERPKRQNSVWVGNLSFKTTPEALSHFFEGVGEITRVHMPTKTVSGGPGGTARKENRGFAYVDFGTPDAKTVAITMSEQLLGGRKLLIKDGGDFTGRPTPSKTEGASEDAPSKSSTGLTKTAKKILANQKQPPAPTIFFGNLGFDTTEDTIKELLKAHRRKSNPREGEEQPAEDVWIRKVRLGTFEDTGKCKGWAFVDFTSIEHATAVLTNPRNHHLNGRELVVEYASPDAVRRGGGLRTGGTQGQHKRERDSTQKDGSRVSSSGRDATVNEAQEESPRDVDSRWWKEAGPLERERKEKGKRPRPTPGAALALAKREQVAIVPSQGSRITFDD